MTDPKKLQSIFSKKATKFIDLTFTQIRWEIASNFWNLLRKPELYWIFKMALSFKCVISNSYKLSKKIIPNCALNWVAKFFLWPYLFSYPISPHIPLFQKNPSTLVKNDVSEFCTSIFRNLTARLLVKQQGSYISTKGRESLC